MLVKVANGSNPKEHKYSPSNYSTERHAKLNFLINGLRVGVHISHDNMSLRIELHIHITQGTIAACHETRLV